MSLLQRQAKKQAPEIDPLLEMGWTGRLHAIGQLLDRYGSPLQDVAIATADRAGWIAALGFHTGVYRAGWSLVSLPIEEAPGDPLPDSAPFASIAPPLAPTSSPPRPAARRLDAKPPAPWAHRLRGVGALLDRAPGAVRDAAVIEVSGGFLVQAHVRFFAAEHRGWILTSREIGERDLKGIIAELPPAEMVRIAYPWRWRAA